jgi:hypothetical protein
MDTWARYFSRGMLTEGQLAATEKEEEEKKKKRREDKWWDTCLSCGKPQQVYKEMFSLIFFNSSSEREKERREGKKRGERKKRKRREERKERGRKKGEEGERKIEELQGNIFIPFMVFLV